MWEGYLTGINISQTIPAGQAAVPTVLTIANRCHAIVLYDTKKLNCEYCLLHYSGHYHYPCGSGSAVERRRHQM